MPINTTSGTTVRTNFEAALKAITFSKELIRPDVLEDYNAKVCFHRDIDSQNGAEYRLRKNKKLAALF